MNKLYFNLLIVPVCICSMFSHAYAGAVIVKLLKAGPTSAVVDYNGQKITVRKYYPKPGESLFGGTTNMGLLTPCIGSQVIAIYDDANGEILGLNCPGKNSPKFSESVKKGNIRGAVIVVPDEYLRLK